MKNPGKLSNIYTLSTEPSIVVLKAGGLMHILYHAKRLVLGTFAQSVFLISGLLRQSILHIYPHTYYKYYIKYKGQ